MKCPCCNNKINNLRLWHGFLTCVRGHLFKIDLVRGERIAIVFESPDPACKVGQSFPVPVGEMFAKPVKKSATAKNAGTAKNKSK